MVLLPIWKGVKFVTSDRQLREKRPRALVVTAVTLALLAVLIFLIPVPYRTRTEGVIWPPNEALVRAGTNGFIARIVAEPNTLVEAGELLIACEDPILRANVTVLKARVQELRARYDAALVADRVQARIVEQELNDVRKELARAEERVADLEIRSGTAGLFVLPQAEDLPDRYLAQGDLVAFILNVDRPTVRVVVPQSRVDLVRQQTEEVLARPAERLGAIVPAFVQREVPEAEEFLPSAILGSFGGGTFAIDPSEESGTKTFERTFQFDLELREPLEQVYVGGRVFVRFDHGRRSVPVPDPDPGARWVAPRTAPSARVQTVHGQDRFRTLMLGGAEDGIAEVWVAHPG
jgi:putative peptide zinc metalloprotease protein